MSLPVPAEGVFCVKAIGSRPKAHVTADGSEWPGAP